jgi:hypothetical protein
MKEYHAEHDRRGRSYFKNACLPWRGDKGSRTSFVHFLDNMDNEEHPI